jgi:murein DD-endopeptidase MepM/ murein hydrolase activator NlpD
MQIISYVGSSCRNRSSAGPKSFLLKLTTKTRDFGDFENSRKLKGLLAFDFVRVPKINFWSLLRPVRLTTLCCCLFIAVTVPYGLFKAFSYFESYTGPLKLGLSYENELDILNGAMTKFAMQNTGGSFDENGNVIGDDGKILTAGSLGIAKAVAYQTYKVKSGDTISSIALKSGLTNISTLIAVNGIDNVRTLRAGQKLRIPNQDGLTYRAGRGDSLNSIASRYSVTVEQLVDVNDLSNGILSVGQELFIPGARMDSASLRKAMGELFICPITAKYRISSYFGPRADPFTGVASRHTGIDLACPTGTPILCTMSGKVVYVGWSSIFGNYVIINHGNGYQTLYGHMSKTLCRTGQTVSQGTRIGLVGSTGYSTGPHLHFTVYKNSKLVDPLSLIKR